MTGQPTESTDLPLTQEGWAIPGLARKAHFFVDSTALCGKWLLPRREYDAAASAAPSPDDCVACRRALTKRQETTP